MKTFRLLFMASFAWVLSGQVITHLDSNPITGTPINLGPAIINTNFDNVATALGLKQATMSSTGPIVLNGATISCPTCLVTPYVLTQLGILGALAPGSIPNGYLATPFVMVNNSRWDLGGNYTLSGFTPRGIYQPAATYAANDTVSFNGIVYASVVSGNIGITPGTDITKWNNIGSQGAAGTTGPAGVAGVTGPTGITGPAGVTGPAGPTGPIGPSGGATTPATATTLGGVIVPASSGFLIDASGNLTITQASLLTKMGVASAGAAGYLSSVDWTTFNAKAGSGACAAGSVVTAITSGVPTCVPGYVLPVGSQLLFSANGVLRAPTAPEVAAVVVKNWVTAAGAVSYDPACSLFYSTGSASPCPPPSTITTSVTPASQTIQQTVGPSGAYTVSYAVTGAALSAPITPTLGVLTGCTNSAFSPTTVVSTGGTATVTVSCGASSTVGTSTLSFSGTSGAFTATVATAALVIQAAPPSPVQKWLMTEGVSPFLDSSGHTNNLTFNGTFGNVAGIPASAPIFNGTTSVATAANSTATNFDGAFSISIWAKEAALGPLEVFAMNYATAGITFAHGANANVYVEIVGPTGSINQQFNYVMTTAVTHLVLTYDGTKTAAGANLYVNGVLQTKPAATTDTLTTSIASATPFSIGAAPAGTALFNGTLTDARIYNRAVPQSEVTGLFNTGLTTPPPAASTITTSVTPASQTIVSGGVASGAYTASYVVTGAALSTAITPTLAIPAGCTNSAFSPATIVAAGGSATTTVICAGVAPIGTSTLSFSGSGGGFTASIATAALVIQPNSGVTLTSTSVGVLTAGVVLTGLDFAAKPGTVAFQNMQFGSRKTGGTAIQNQVVITGSNTNLMAYPTGFTNTYTGAADASTSSNIVGFLQAVGNFVITINTDTAAHNCTLYLYYPGNSTNTGTLTTAPTFHMVGGGVADISPVGSFVQTGGTVAANMLAFHVSYKDIAAGTMTITIPSIMQSGQAIQLQAMVVDN